MNDPQNKITLPNLIAELCPDGVEFKKLGDICEFRRGVRVVKKQLFQKGIPVYQNSLTPLGYYDNSNVKGETTFVICAGAAGEIGYSTEDFWAADDCFYVVPQKFVLNKFIYYFLQTREKYIKGKVRTASIPRLSHDVITSLTIPIPPIEVQREIVRILDKFTELISLLETERIMRVKQYDYYREKLLTFSDDVQRVQLGEIANISRGASPRPIHYFLTDSETGINWIKIGDVSPHDKYINQTKERITVEGAEKSKKVKAGDFILSNSMSFGRPYILKIDGCIHDGWLSISDFSDSVTSDYLYHVLLSSQVQRQMAQKASFGGAVSNLNADKVKTLEIPLPPLSEQKRIADMLDRFDALCNDTASGIPAEIAARKKQYEYYRDRLLTFREKTAAKI